MKKHNAFTLIELMVVILIVAVLAAAAVPLMRGRIDRSKWTEANAVAGSIRTSMKTYFMETGNTVTGSLNDASVQQALSDKSLQQSTLTGMPSHKSIPMPVGIRLIAAVLVISAVTRRRRACAGPVRRSVPRGNARYRRRSRLSVPRYVPCACES